MSNHAPTPWTADIGDRLSDGSDCWVIDSEMGSVAEMMCPADVEESTARFLVRAVNSHQALIGALKTLDWAGQIFEKPSLGQQQFIGAFKKALEEARAVLKEAEVK